MREKAREERRRREKEYAKRSFVSVRRIFTKFSGIVPTAYKSACIACGSKLPSYERSNEAFVGNGGMSVARWAIAREKDNDRKWKTKEREREREPREPLIVSGSRVGLLTVHLYLQIHCKLVACLSHEGRKKGIGWRIYDDETIAKADRSPYCCAQFTVKLFTSH